MLPLPAGTDFGIYTLLDTLGHGGFAFVYLARDKQLGRRVCIKEHAPEDICERDPASGEIAPKPGMESAFAASLADFQREAEVLAALHHAQIPAVHEIFESGGTAYVVTEYAEGLPLPQWLAEEAERRHQLPLLLESALRILQSLHREGVLHRDIKPGHLIVDAAGRVRLVDFGAAVPAGARHTPVFTPPYSPPEQNMQGTAGAWSDLYSLAASFRSVLLNEPPQEALQRLESDRLRPLADNATLRREFPEPFLRGIDRALSLLPEERFESAEAWLAALKRHETPQPARNRRTIAIVVIVTLCAVVARIIAMLVGRGLAGDTLVEQPAEEPPPAALRQEAKPQPAEEATDPWDDDYLLQDGKDMRERMLKFVDGAK